MGPGRSAGGTPGSRTASRQAPTIRQARMARSGYPAGLPWGGVAADLSGADLLVQLVLDPGRCQPRGLHRRRNGVAVVVQARAALRVVRVWLPLWPSAARPRCRAHQGGDVASGRDLINDRVSVLLTVVLAGPARSPRPGSLPLLHHMDQFVRYQAPSLEGLRPE